MYKYLHMWCSRTSPKHAQTTFPSILLPGTKGKYHAVGKLVHGRNSSYVALPLSGLLGFRLTSRCSRSYISAAACCVHRCPSSKIHLSRAGLFPAIVCELEALTSRSLGARCWAFRFQILSPAGCCPVCHPVWGQSFPEKVWKGASLTPLLPHVTLPVCRSGKTFAG